ncbi:phage tail tip lysozyme [Methylobacterium sp. GXS13]|uniref:phage tail tip lysozyme n=1 Tax=Methylobacterium sp. GXS13 TaxID=1730094 RepID=UPI000A3E253C|nr:phage tail tip lysozyme [Methylobacterium sp. GXS13]
MPDEVLRMQAEVQDRFSGPLKALRAQLLDTSRQGAAHGEALAKGLNKAEAAAQATANTAKTVLNPALAAIGVTGLGTGVAVAGVVNALNSLGSSLSSLGQLGRETGMAADQLRVFQSVAGKFGVSGDASSAAAKTFSQNMRDIRRGVGETMGFLQSQNQVVAQFAIKLKGSKNNDEALKMAEEFMEQIPNAVDRGRFAEKLFGNMDLGRLGDKHLGAIRDLNAKAAEKLGPLDPKMVESAERYERSLADLRSSMSKIGTTIASELMVPAERFTSWLDDLASGKRGDVTKALRDGLQDVKRELEAINWKQAGDDAAAFLKESTALAGSLAKAFQEVAEVIHSLRSGDYAEALARADSASGPVLPGKEAGADGPLRRRLAPRLGDDEIAAQQRVDDLRKLRDASREAGNYLIGRTQQRMGLIDSPEAAQQKLDAAEAELNRLKARTPEQRQKDYEQSTERLRKSVDNLSEQLKTKQDATAQKSSLDADGLFGDARVQTASLGGARIFGGPGGTGPIPEAQRDAAREAFRKYLMKKVPGYDGGAMVPTGPGGRIPGLGDGTPRLPGVGGGSAPRGDGSGTAGSARTSQMMGYAMDQLRREGVPEDKLREAAAHLVGQATMESGLDPNKVHDGGTGYGIYGARDPKGWGNYRGARRSDMVRWLEANGYARNSAEGQMREMAHSAMSGRYPRTRSILMGGSSGNLDGDTNAITKEFESPAIINRRSDAVRNALRAGPDAAAGRLSGLPRPDGARADGDAWAAREKARKAFEAMQKGEGRLDASAGRAGVVGGTKVEANGSVNVLVQKPGPDTNVRTSASGNLFKDVVLSRGRTMASAGGS